MACFWRNGYMATSTRDLATEMGIGGVSLYNAFGDKRTLFTRALERYQSSVVRTYLAEIARDCRPPDILPAFFADIIEQSLGDRERRGCLLVNAALEVAPHDAAIAAQIAPSLNEIETFFRRTLRAGHRDGSIPKVCRADEAAKLMPGVLVGLRVLARAKPERAQLEGVVAPMLALLGLTALPRSADKRRALRTGLSRAAARND